MYDGLARPADYSFIFTRMDLAACGQSMLVQEWTCQHADD